ncbi:uncharacterized protein LOC103375882, partial [Stegastes partitus]|uniref:Sm protein G n=1 Tax=Stegastes partitus TaxID=144197 RepID=A0A9Y4NW83_9TELE
MSMKRVLNVILCGIRKGFKGLRFNVLNSAETLGVNCQSFHTRHLLMNTICCSLCLYEAMRGTKPASKSHRSQLQETKRVNVTHKIPDRDFFSILSVKLNGGRHVQGILRGFDPFMNLVVDDCLEMGPGGQQNTIGMV